VLESRSAPFRTHCSLQEDLQRIGLCSGDTVMVHAAMSKVGRLLDGPDTFIRALVDTVGPTGTIVAYTDWNSGYDELLDESGYVLSMWRSHVLPFDPRTSRAIRSNGVFPEFLRTTPGAVRSGNPAASVTAIGEQAVWITADHPLDYGYGQKSPLAKLIALKGKVLMTGAPLDTMTLLHHAEHIARIPGKRIRRYEVPFVAASGPEWRMTEEYDTANPVVPSLEEGYFATIVEEFLATGEGARGVVGEASSVLVDAPSITAFAVDWLESRLGKT
jgi:aminoglycoside 3-N-acetyltransferase